MGKFGWYLVALSDKVGNKYMIGYAWAAFVRKYMRTLICNTSITCIMQHPQKYARVINTNMNSSTLLASILGTIIYPRGSALILFALLFFWSVRLFVAAPYRPTYPLQPSKLGIYCRYLSSVFLEFSKMIHTVSNSCWVSIVWPRILLLFSVIAVVVL